MVESPEMFRNAANQSFSQQAKPYGHATNKGTPLRGNMKKKIPSRPSSAQSNKGVKMATNNHVLPGAINQKTGQSM
jgi:hypothetical protein